MNPEVAANFSGGGFSNYFSRPDYQNTAVPAYINRIGGKYYGLYKYVVYTWKPSWSLRVSSPSGRGYPDISAQARNYQIVVNKTVRPVDGTSCSAPVRFTTVIPRPTPLTQR